LRSPQFAMDGVIASVHGGWPRDRIRVAFRRYASSSPWATGALPFARILRNMPEGILFYVSPEARLTDLISDWTAYHEFAHLFITYPGQADAWFSEGLASYYQNILQVRAGTLGKDTAIARYAAAFQRGRDDNRHDDLDLARLSANMMQRRAFMRVYWSGALYFMEADLALRALPEPSSVDAVLRAYGECCLAEGRESPARQIAADFDRAAGADVFVPLFGRYASTTAIPDYEDVLERFANSAVLSEPRM